MTVTDEPVELFGDGSGPSTDSGGEPSSSAGSSSAPEPIGEPDERGRRACPECGQRFVKLGVHRFQKHGVPAGSTEPDEPGEPGEPTAPDEPPAAAEQRPASERKRGLFTRRPRPKTEAVLPSQARPRSAKRVSTAPLTATILAFAAGGLDRMGQGPLAMTVSFTAPVAGEIVDDAVAGTLPDKLLQPLVRGSEKYQNVSALFSVWAAVAWASNNPENAETAYGLYRWGMSVILPLAGKEMVARAKAEKKAADALADILPELRELGFGDDPIRGFWETAWRQPVRVPEPDHEGVPA